MSGRLLLLRLLLSAVTQSSIMKLCHFAIEPRRDGQTYRRDNSWIWRRPDEKWIFVATSDFGINFCLTLIIIIYYIPIDMKIIKDNLFKIYAMLFKLFFCYNYLVFN